MTAVADNEMRAELLDARRQLLVATQNQSRAIEAWALVMTHLEDVQAPLDEARRERDQAYPDVARLTALVAALEDAAGQARS